MMRKLHNIYKKQQPKSEVDRQRLSEGEGDNKMNKTFKYQKIVVSCTFFSSSMAWSGSPKTAASNL